MSTCRTNIPKSLKKKVCVKKKYMGGHKDSIINHVSGNQVRCAKLVNEREYEFILKIEKDPIKKYIPKIYGICTHNNKEYLILENVFSPLLPKKYKFIDIKIGHRTAYYPDSDYLKNIRHGVMDRYLSTTKRYGYRVEGLNFKINGRHIKSKHRRHNITNQELWSNFLTPKIKPKLLRKLKELLSILESNINRRSKRFGLLGSSLLIAHNNDKVVLKIIDFGRSFYDRSKFTKKLAIDFYESVLNLYQTIQLW